ncbi:MAG: reverse transcriptase/maturase family protein [Patescibacteria group bacterium]
MTDQILLLHHELKSKIYKHGPYHAFKINDPKPRDIHKASVRDRLVHHAVYRILYPYFDKKFIYDSYSCRLDRGAHKAIGRFKNFAQTVSLNNTRTAWILKGDIRKFFASIDHDILQNIFKKYITDSDILWLLDQLINSFHTKGKINVGLPLGNLTSQLFVNIYMNEFDQFVKRKLKVGCYIRYADDFVIFSNNKFYLEQLIQKLSEFLKNKLKLTLHPDKLFIKTLASGVDFLGWIIFPHHLILRTSTKKRMFKKLKKNHSIKSLASYTGILDHGNTHNLTRKIKTLYSDFFIN